MTAFPTLARKMWRTLEPYHALVYFVPEAKEAYAAAGISGGRMGYFASRAAPMGAVAPEVVVATFYNFAPDSVAKAIPAAWDLVTPDRMIEARFVAADRALRRLIPDAIESGEMKEAADLARVAAEGCPLEGRPLFAGHASVAWPEAPHLALWHAVTLLREFRGDAHVAALMLEGIGGLEALVVDILSGQSKLPVEIIQVTRGWSDDDWKAAEARLRDRGLVGSGGLTPDGETAKQRVEDMTDEAAVAPWQHLGAERADRLRELVRPWSKAISAGAFGGAPT